MRLFRGLISVSFRSGYEVGRAGIGDRTVKTVGCLNALNDAVVWVRCGAIRRKNCLFPLRIKDHALSLRNSLSFFFFFLSYFEKVANYIEYSNFELAKRLQSRSRKVADARQNSSTLKNEVAFLLNARHFYVQ